MKKQKIAVIGGGAAGMMAAITAARRGADVTVLEAGERCGKKILSTGNGKCNLGNELMNADCYHGGRKQLIEGSLARFGTGETQSFFGSLGLMIRSRNGYLYPYCEQASAVLDVLRFEMEALHIRVITECTVKDVRPDQKKGYLISVKGSPMQFDRVILTCGGKAAPKTGSDGSGYELAKKFGHRIVPVVPALTALKCRESFFKGIAGIRCDALLTAELSDQCEKSDKKRKAAQNGKEVQDAARKSVCLTERGELQLTDYGISGIPVFQMSGSIAYALKNQNEIAVHINLMPDLTKEDLSDLLDQRLLNLKDRTAEEFFTGTINKKLILHFLKEAGIKTNTPVREIGRDKLWKVLCAFQDFRVTVFDTNGFQNAQVCAGGVNLNEINENMESKLQKGLYFAGEILDVDGRCGGYNLQWAWCSGYLAGMAAAEQ